jgi:hypothetical protein
VADAADRKALLRDSHLGVMRAAAEAAKLAAGGWAVPPEERRGFLEDLLVATRRIAARAMDAYVLGRLLRVYRDGAPTARRAILVAGADHTAEYVRRLVRSHGFRALQHVRDPGDQQRCVELRRPLSFASDAAPVAS